MDKIMIGFQIIGIVTVVVFFIAGIVRLTSPCSIDHDLAARHGTTKCPKCGEEI